MTCVTFYREVDARPFWLAYECVHPRNTGPDAISAANPNGDSESDTGEIGLRSSFPHKVGAVAQRNDTIFMPTSVCLVSRLPYFDLLKGCLASVLPTLLADPTAINSVLERLMAKLSCIPMPAPGPSTLSFRLEQGGPVLDCLPPPHVDLPVIDFPVRLLMMMLKPADLLTIVTALLIERRVIFLSKDYALLTPVIEAVLGLLYPFKWRHVYIPLVPAHMCELQIALFYCRLGVGTLFPVTNK